MSDTTAASDDINRKTHAKRVARQLKAVDETRQQSSVFGIRTASRSSLLTLRPKRLSTMRIPYSVLKASERTLKQWTYDAIQWNKDSASVEIGHYLMSCSPMVCLRRIDNPDAVQYISPGSMSDGLSNLTLE